MTRSICIVDAHPDPDPARYVHALCDAYAQGAADIGHTVSRIRIADLDVPLMTSGAEFEAPPPEPILSEREKIAAADHVVIIFPLWLGSLPAKARAFLEQAARGGFFLEETEDNKGWPKRLMKGKSARVVVTMGMPGIAYSLLMDQGSLKAIERALLGLSGFKPVHHTVLGGVDGAGDEKRKAWLEEMRALGARAG